RQRGLRVGGAEVGVRGGGRDVLARGAAAATLGDRDVVARLDLPLGLQRDEVATDGGGGQREAARQLGGADRAELDDQPQHPVARGRLVVALDALDRKSTRLNSSHVK